MEEVERVSAVDFAVRMARMAGRERGREPVSSRVMTAREMV